jgi:hypothetical protein
VTAGLLQVFAAWSTSGFPHITRLPGLRGCWDVVDHLGAARPRICEDNRGIHVNLTDAPQYLTSVSTAARIPL